MKLKNKKTGEIVETCEIFENLYGKIRIRKNAIKSYDYEYNSLAELAEEWKDVPEEAIQIHIEGIQNVYMGGCRVYIDYATAKEAWEAVDKLKAWKRLKDKGIKFKGVSGYDEIHFWFPNPDDMFENSDTRKDLDLLFGGEE